MEEYIAVKKRLTCGKAPGPDGITPEVLKYCDLDEIVLGYANNLLINGEKPDQWSENNIIPLPNKGDLSKACNYRGISLSSIIAKTVNRLILNRIQPALDKHLRNNQNGFRPGRSTTAQILALRRIIEGVKEKNLEATIIFIDFRKAFDSIHRTKMLKILKAYGIPDQLVNAIRILYENTRAKIITPDGETSLFDIIAGVLQGDTLAPYIFIIILDYAMKQALRDNETELGFQIRKRMSRRIGAEIITDLDFADDIALITETLQQGQELLSRVESSTARVGLHLNADKTEVMIYNQTTTDILKSKSNEIIKKVEEFKYLGAWMSASDKDIKIRKAQAWSVCHKLQKIWKSTLNKSLKIRIFLATVESVLLYGSETWTITKQVEKGLDGAYTRMLRMACNVSWMQHIRNEDLYGPLPMISTKIREKRLKLAGHCIRHPEEIAHKLVLWEPTTGKRSKGRKRLTYVDMLKKDTDLETTADLRTAMNDRNIWKGYIKSVRAGARPK